MQNLLVAVLSAALSVTAVMAQTVLPFRVKLGGQEARLRNASDIFAVVDTAVPNNAEIEVDVTTEMIIINVFHSDDRGNATGAPAVIMIQGGNKTTLDKTMDLQTLEPGTYLMNIVAGGNTARVLFKVM